MKLNIGCGTDIREGYINIDKFYKHDKVLNLDVYDIKNKFIDNSVDEILLIDVLEHVPFRLTNNVIKNVYDILKPNGTIYVKTPDIDKQIQQYIDKKWDINIFTYMVLGGQDSDGNFHNNFFTMNKLKNILTTHGFIIIEENYIHRDLTSNITNSANANIEVRARKP